MGTAWEKWPAGDPQDACLILDFDGTLAPIVEDPATSQMPEQTRVVLQQLAGRLGRVGIVSGRSAHFLADRVGVDGVEMVGLYGLERVVDGRVEPDERVQPYVTALEEARTALAEVVADWDGAELEDKGLALAVHWRRTADTAAAGEALPAAVRSLAGDLAVEDGKMVVELRPPVPADKGTAVRMLADGYSRVAYAGDDLGDLPAFEAVTAAGGVALAVNHGAETDARVRRSATAVVAGTEGLAAWLERLAGRLEGG